MKSLLALVLTCTLISTSLAELAIVPLSSTLQDATGIGSDGMIEGNFGPGGGKTIYYAASQLQSGELLIQTSLEGRGNVDKKLTLELLDKNAKTLGSVVLSTVLDANEEQTRAFPIDVDGRYILRVTTEGPETTHFLIRLGGTAFNPKNPVSAPTEDGYSRSALQPIAIDKSGVVEGTFPPGTPDHKTYYYFSANLTPGTLASQLTISGRTNIEKNVEFTLLNSSLKRLGSYYVRAGLEAKADETHSFPIDSAGHYIIRLTLKGMPGAHFRTEVGGSAFRETVPAAGAGL